MNQNPGSLGSNKLLKIKQTCYREVPEAATQLLGYFI